MTNNTDPVRALAWAKLEREWAIDGMPADKIRLARAAFDAGAALASAPPSAPVGAAESAEPAVWVAADTLHSPHPVCISSLAYMSQLDRERGREYVPLYTATQQSAGVTEEMVERAGQALYGTDWGSFERWEADQLKRKVRAVLTAALAAQQPATVDRARFRKAPCYLCGYNGAGYFQSETHPCAALYHAAQQQGGAE